jgi:hypothetical protein
MAPRFKLLVSPSSRKKERRCACLSVANVSHWLSMWAEVSSSAPPFHHSGLSVNLIIWRCLRSVLCPVSSPVTTQNCILLKDRILTLVTRQGPEINFRACRWEFPRSCQIVRCPFPSQRLILFLKTYLENPKADSGPTNPEAVPFLASPSAVSLPLTLSHAQRPNIVPQHAESRYHLTPSEINESMGTLF